MAATKVWTLDDLAALPDDGNKYEVIHGALFVTPGPEPPHEGVIGVLHALLVSYVARHGLGLVYSGHPVIRISDSEVQPDLVVRRRIDPAVRWEHTPLPILVVEVASPSTRRRDRVQKRDFYAELGIAEYWIIDPGTRTLTVIKPGEPDLVTRERLMWHPTGASAAIMIDVAELFR